MLRLAVVLQLVVSLVLGPVLCCCTAARLSRGPTADARPTATGKTGPRKSCCGPPATPADIDRRAPTGPVKCPCKNASVDATAPEVAAGAAAVPFDAPTRAVAPPPERTPNARPTAPHFASRSSSMPASDLLDAHHKLRC